MTRIARPGYGRRFAQYYDSIYHPIVDYEGDVDFFERVFRRFHSTPKTILDLGCGTGSHDFALSRRGYHVTGIDRSREMLSLARKKAARVDRPPRFVIAGMESFRVPETFDAAICMFGAFAYLLENRDVTRCLRHVRAHLVPEGLFVFEYWQTSGVRTGIQSWLDQLMEGREIIRLSESRFDPRTSRLAMEFRFLVLRGPRVVDRFSERHVVRTHERRDLGLFLRRTAFDRIGEFAGTPQEKRFRRVTPDTFRIMAIARAR